MTDHYHPQTQLSLDFDAAAPVDGPAMRPRALAAAPNASMHNKAEPVQRFQLYQFRAARSNDTARIYDRILASIKHLG